MAVDEALAVTLRSQRRGGWTAIPFIIGTKLTVGTATFGLLSNLTVYLIEQFNIPRIHATQISNIITGFTNFAPLIGAILADSGLGCFNVISGASAAAFLGTILFMLISIVSSLRPPACLLEVCQAPTMWQLANLYVATALIIAGVGGTRFLLGTLGVTQMNNDTQQTAFFNWFVVTLYTTGLLGLTIIVYVQANVSWAYGFGLCAIFSGVGLLVFFLGSQYYRPPEPKRNPYLTLLRKMLKSTSETQMFYNKLDDGSINEAPTLFAISNEQTDRYREETKADDFSSVLGLMPLMSTGILVGVSIQMITSLSILQSLVMERRIFNNFSIPASSMTTFTVIGAIISVPLFDHAIFPVYHRLSHRTVTPLDRIGVGNFIIVLAALASAATESRRLKALSSFNDPMPVLWLVPGLALVGFADALNLSGQLAFYYQEFPTSLSSSGTGVVALLGATGAFGTSGAMSLVRRITWWLSDDVNRSRLDNVYWMLVVAGALNMGYFMICAKLYKQKKIQV